MKSLKHNYNRFLTTTTRFNVIFGLFTTVFLSQSSIASSEFLNRALATSFSQDESIISDLTPEELVELNAGNQVTRTVEVDGSVWPRITVYQRTTAQPEELAAVFTDYSLHKEFFEGMTKSEVLEEVSALEHKVAYTLTFPPVLGIQLEPENYTVLDTLKQLSPQSYVISWAQIQADSLKNTEGAVTIEPYFDANQKLEGSIIRYDSLIVPPRPALAKLLVKMAIQRVQETCDAFQRRTLMERNEMPDLLSQQVARLRAALEKK